MSALMDAMAMSPRGWWRRHPLPDAVAAPVADSHLAFGGLIAFTFILLLAPQLMVPALAVLSFIRPALFAASVAAVSYLCNRMLTGRPLTVFTRELWLGAALLVWASITVPVSYWPGGSVAVIAGVFVKSLLVFWLIANVVNTPERLRRFMIVLSLAGAPLALTAILNYRAGVFMEGATAVKRITGYDAPLTQNPNDLALMLNLLVPLAIGLLLTRPRPLLRTLLLMTVGLEAVGIILTFSRAGFLAMGVTTVAWLWKFRRRRERGWVLAILMLGIACLPLLPSGYTKRLATMIHTEADPTGSAQARWHDTVAAIGYVSENPVIGAGIGQDILALNEVRGLGWRSVHNVYLQYAVDLGLPGAILFVVLLGFCLSSAASVERSGLGEDLPALAAGIRISLVGFVAAACFHPAGYHFYFFYIAGLAVSLRLIATSIRSRAAAAPLPEAA
jgi:O-antigen ligase